MRRLTVGSASLNQTPLDWEGNTRRIMEAIAAARSHGVRFLCLPELAITGYGCEDLFLSPFVAERSLEQLTLIATATADMVVVVGTPLASPQGVWNTACTLVNGELAGIVPKQKLAADGLHYEFRWFKAWSFGAITKWQERVPLGDLVFDIDGIRLGIEICEDSWVANRPLASFAARGVDIVFNPSASHFALDKHLIRRRYAVESSRSAGVCFALANLLGCEAGRVIFDGHCCIAAGGEILAESSILTLDEVHLTIADVDLAAERSRRWAIGSLVPNFALDSIVHCSILPCSRENSNIVDAGQEPSAISASPSKLTIFTTPPLDPTPFEQFSLAASLGLLDYLQKSHCDGFVLSLSGGADSTAVATLVAIAAHRLSNHEGRLASLPPPYKDPINQPQSDSNWLLKELLWCVYQRTKQNSDATLTSAKAVAQGLGAHFINLDIDNLISNYIELGEIAIGRPLKWSTDDTTLQNIQSRARSPLIWLIANARNSLLLTTGNRSECSVGYFTMDGDSSGGLNPLAGVSKIFIKEWLEWLEHIGFSTPGAPVFGPLPFLNVVNSLPPSAELRPVAENQTDESDLMPYRILNAIEEAFLRHRMDPREIWQALRSTTASEEEDLLLSSRIAKFFRLWASSQWKRERAAPSFHIDKYNVDPRSWARFPILSSGFEKEIDDLTKSVIAKKKR